MTHNELKQRAVYDQAREDLADVIDGLRDTDPAFLLSVCAAIDTGIDPEAVDGATHVQMPAETFAFIGRLAVMGLTDLFDLLKGRQAKYDR